MSVSSKIRLGILISFMFLEIFILFILSYDKHLRILDLKNRTVCNHDPELILEHNELYVYILTMCIKIIITFLVFLSMTRNLALVVNFVFITYFTFIITGCFIMNFPRNIYLLIIYYLMLIVNLIILNKDVVIIFS